MKNPNHRIRRKSAHLHKAHRGALIKEKGMCFWCNAPLTSESATLDHIIAIGTIGAAAETPENWVLCCQGCQKTRKAKGEMGNPFLPHQKSLEKLTRFLRGRAIPETLENYIQEATHWVKNRPGDGEIKLFLSLNKNLEVQEVNPERMLKKPEEPKP